MINYINVNLDFYEKVDKDFYTSIFTDTKKKDFVVGKIKSSYLKMVDVYTKGQVGYNFNFLLLDKTGGIVEINIADDKDINKHLNSNKALIKYTQNILKTNFRFSGEFRFVEDLLPF